MEGIASTLWQLDNRELVARISASESKLRQHYAEHLALLAEADARGTAHELGYSSTTALLLHILNITRGEASQRLAHATALNDATTPTGVVIEASSPLTAKKLDAGEISIGQVEVIRKFIASLTHLEPDKAALAEELLIERAAQDDPHALARYGEQIVRDIVDPDGKPPNLDESQRPERELRRHVYRDGHMEFKGRLDAETAALFNGLLTPFEKYEPDDTRGYAERSGDAFADVLQQAANCPDLPTQNGLKTEVAFTISLDQLMKAAEGHVLSDAQLTPAEVRRIACDAHVLPAVMGGESKPLDVAVPAYAVPAHIRRGLVLRDRGCAFPSCERPASVCHAHHIVPWLQGGPTSMDNTVLLCGHHHRLIHRSDWTVELKDDVAWFTPPDFVDPERKPRRNLLHRRCAASPYSLG
ncbi:HNH endonuclease [Kibdelosporangium philippinense]|uniref:HNH endonuclease n=1 Tax=Kibdelosporangium philippinense TaxID=211113 RepID=A0ABS8ZUE7_9PSEU|nr:HNH endonuclease signature motif containing protein [Kibdelosporangium philippinense]MCE7010858.1 HNH endonuclease [Kibdelosporangium philippinense]